MRKWIGGSEPSASDDEKAWYPLGGRGYTAELLGNEVISEVVVIPGAGNPDHIKCTGSERKA